MGNAESDVNDAELSSLAAELRERLTAEECRRLAELLAEERGPQRSPIGLRAEDEFTGAG